MKGKFSILAGIMALGAAGTTMWALSHPTGELLEPTLLQNRTISTHRNATSKTSETSDGFMYWTVARSCYKESQINFEDGDLHQFGTRIEIDGDIATIYGLVDLYYDEVDKEYAVQGKYDYRYNTITIEGTRYDSNKPLSSFIKLADMYSLTDNTDYTLVLFAGDMMGEQLETIDKLVFKVSDDLSTLTSVTGYGAYAFSTAGSPMAFYDYYQPGVRMNMSTSDSGISTSSEELTFNGLFIAANMLVKETLYVYNRSTEETTFTITSSSADLTPAITEGVIAPCSSRAVEVMLNPSEPGRFEGSLTIKSPSAKEPLVVKVDVDVWEQLDYAKITKAGSALIEFDKSPIYPFILSEYDGHIAAKSTNNGKADYTQSFFICKLDVPQGETGVFSWDAAQITRQPNTMIIYLDNVPIKYAYDVQTTQPVDMSGVVALSERQHEVIFAQDISMDWTEYGIISEGYVWGLDFQLMESQENIAYLVNEEADFGSTYYDGFSIDMATEVTLLNIGTAALKVTDVIANGNFSGKVPSISVPQGGEIAVPLTWTASAVGEDTGEVVIVTTAGEFTVKCKGMGENLPYDYSQFVTEGEIAFNTDVAWPFKVSDNGKYLYNSTSKADIDGVTESWIEAIFEVPEGKVGMISWEAINDSENIFSFMNIPYQISGTRFTIDGTNEEMVGGQNVNCSSANIYTPEQLTFKTGQHSVRFTYKKSANDEESVFGDDCLKLFEIALKLENLDDHKADISTNEATYPNPVYVGCAGHYPVTIINYTSEVPELIASTCDGPFVAKTTGVTDGNLNLLIEFTPRHGGEYENELTISTNIGDFTINCKGSAQESELGTAIFYESFEYDFESNWIFANANEDENTWERLSFNKAEFINMGILPYDGNEGLVLKSYDIETSNFFETNDYAITPKITIPADGVTTLRIMVMSWSYGDQYLEILAGEGDDITSYQVVEKLTFNMSGTWEAHQVNLSALTGKTVHIAFRGYDIVDIIAIDDVLVATTGTVGVSSIENDKKVVTEEYFTTSGLKLTRPINGVNVVVTKYSDGTSTMTKRVIK